MAKAIDDNVKALLHSSRAWQGVRNKYEEFSEIHLASMKGNFKLVRKLINQGCDIDAVIPTGLKKGCTALHIAAEYEQAETIKVLLNNGANIYVQNDYGSTPLHSAFESKRVSTKLLILLKMNEYSEITNNKGVSHFHIACSTDEVNIVEKFILNGAELNSQIHSYSKFRGDTPLHIACSNGVAKTVKYLLEKGADFTLKNANNETPLHTALKVYCDKAVRLILKAYFTICSKLNENIEKIFTKNNISTDININLNERFMENFRPLHFAVKFQLLEIIKILIENGIDVKTKDSNGMTALHCAVQDTQMGLLQEDYLDMCLHNIDSQDEGEINTFSRKLIKIIDLLLKSGCDVNDVDNFGRTPIFYLYDRLSQRAELKEPSLSKNPPQSRAMGTGYSAASARKSIIHLLLSYSPALGVQDHKGNTVLHLMAKAGNSFVKFEAEIAEEYLRGGGDVNALNHEGYTPLHYTCGNGHTELLNVLLRYGADVNLTRSEKMERPIHRAVCFLRSSHCRARCTRSKYHMVEQLLRHGAHLDATMANGMTPILLATNPLIASASSNNPLIMCLLNWGCDLNCADSVGRTPLHYICKHKNLPMLEVFLKHGADINAMDHHGNTPFSVVRKSNRFSLVDSLVLFSYVKRLQILGVPLCYTNRMLYVFHDSLVSLCDGVNDKLREILTDEQCWAQLEFMKTIHVDNYTTLYDILLKSTNSLVHHVNNERLLNIVGDVHFDDDYSVYGYLIKSKMKSATKRAALLKPAKETLVSILNFDMPNACLHGILSHLGIKDLKNLIEAKETKRAIDDTEEESTRGVKRCRLSEEINVYLENDV